MRHNWFLTRIGHDALNRTMLLFWLACLARGGPWRRGALYMALIAAVVLGLRYCSPFPCPWDVPEFGGRNPDAGRCLPAAHPLVGFALFGLWQALKLERPRLARYTLIVALVLGFGAGAMQAARGAHFVSHVLWAAWLAWFTTLALAAAAPSRT